MGDIALVEGNNVLNIVLAPILKQWMVSVSVRDTNTMERINGAIVRIIGIGSQVTVRGFATFYNVPEGTYDVSVNALGYDSQAKTVEVYDYDRAVNFYL